MAFLQFLGSLLVLCFVLPADGLFYILLHLGLTSEPLQQESGRYLDSNACPAFLPRWEIQVRGQASPTRKILLIS